MWRDPIIEELHQIRDEQAKKFNYDLRAIFNDLKEQEKRNAGRVVSLPIKRSFPLEEATIVEK